MNLQGDNLQENKNSRAYVGESDIQKKYVDYITKSSFPYALKLDNAKEIRMYLDGLYNTVIVNDIAERKDISDIAMLKDVIKFMFNNVGNISSSTSIANTMTSNGRKISVPTVEKYLEALVESFVQIAQHLCHIPSHLKCYPMHHQIGFTLHFSVIE